MTWAAPGYLKTAAHHLRLGAERAGRDPDEVDLASYIRVAVVDNLDQVRPAMQREIANYCSRPFYKSYFDQEGFPAEAAAIGPGLVRGGRQVGRGGSYRRHDQAASGFRDSRGLP